MEVDFTRGGEPLGYVTGSTGTRYTIFGHPGNKLRCSCPAWKNQHLPADQRTCKHIRQFEKAVRDSDTVSTDRDVEFVTT